MKKLISLLLVLTLSVCLLAACGKPVVYLKRLSMGELRLDETLKKGEFRPLTAEEVKSLQR